MRTMILLLLASCTYPVTNVVNEITATDARAPADDVATMPDAGQAVGMPDVAVADAGQDVAVETVDAAPSDPPDTYVPAVDAGPFAVCSIPDKIVNNAWTYTQVVCGQPWQISWGLVSNGTDSSCRGQGRTGSSGTACTPGEQCQVLLTSSSTQVIFGTCQ